MALTAPSAHRRARANIRESFEPGLFHFKDVEQGGTRCARYGAACKEAVHPMCCYLYIGRSLQTFRTSEVLSGHKVCSFLQPLLTKVTDSEITLSSVGCFLSFRKLWYRNTSVFENIGVVY